MTARHIETPDLVLAAFLKVSGCNLDRIDKHGTKGTFCFSNVPDDLVHQYDLGNGVVEPRAFNDTVKALTAAVRRTS